MANEITHDQHDRYPDAEGDYIRVPYMRQAKAMNRAADGTAAILNNDGILWMIGEIDGVLHRSRL